MAEIYFMSFDLDFAEARMHRSSVTALFFKIAEVAAEGIL